MEKLKEEKESVKNDLSKEVNSLKTQMNKQSQDHEKTIHNLKLQHTNITDQLKQELQRVHEIVLSMKEHLRIDNLCRQIGFSKEQAIALLAERKINVVN